MRVTKMLALSAIAGLCSASIALGQPSIEWIQKVGVDNWAVAVDGNGGGYISGDEGGSGIYTDAYLGHFNEAGEVGGVPGGGLLHTNFDDVSYAVAADGLGGVISAGSTKGYLPGGPPGTPSIGGWDAFLAKYDATGRQWIRQFGTTLDDEVFGASMDDLGGVYVAGRTFGDLDGAGPEFNHGQFDAFLSKFDATGNLQWTRQFGTSGSDVGTSGWDVVYGMTTDHLGGVYLTGSTEGDIDAGGPGSHYGSRDAFLAKYDSAGGRQWIRQLGSLYGDEAYGVAADGAGGVYIAGYTGSDMDGVGPGPFGEGDGFLSKFDAVTGNLQWTRQYGTSRGEFLGSSRGGIAADGLGGIFVASVTEGDFIGGGPGSPGGWDMFVRKFDAAGAHQWTWQYNSGWLHGYPNEDVAHAVVTDGAGGVYVTGYAIGDHGGTGYATKSGLLIKLLDREAHEWASRLLGDAWSNTGAWATPGTPAYNWTAYVRNASLSPYYYPVQTSIVDGSYVVNELNVYGGNGSIYLSIPDGSSLEVLSNAKFSAGGFGALAGELEVHDTLTIQNSVLTVVSSGELYADTIALNGGALATEGNSSIYANSLQGFGDAITFNGNLSVGCNIGDAVGSHTVRAGQHLQVNGVLYLSGSDADGTLTVENGGTATTEGVYVGGNPSRPGGAGMLRVEDGGAVTVDGALRVWPSGDVELDHGSTSTHGIDLYGTLRGPGAVQIVGRGDPVLDNAGIIRPGINGGQLDVIGDYVQEATGTLSIGIGGAGSAQYDKMVVTEGTATLDGILKVSVMPGYDPAVGDSFRILTTPLGGLSGRFATTSWLPLPDGKRWSVVYDYDPWLPKVLPSVLLKVLAPIEGDFNGDGVVDRDDFLAWKSNFGLIGSATHAQGDADGDRDVDGADFLVWQRQLGVGANAPVEGSVPEPSGVALIVAAALGLWARGRRR
jgi:hypothetical protein